MAEINETDEFLGGATPPEAPPEEAEVVGAEATIQAPGGSIELTAEQLPDLGALNPGDNITLRLESVSEDGNTFTLTTVGEGEAAAIPDEAAKQQIADQLGNL